MEVASRACKVQSVRGSFSGCPSSNPSTSGRQHSSCGAYYSHAPEAFHGVKQRVYSGGKRGGDNLHGRPAWNPEALNGPLGGRRQQTVAQALKIDRSRSSNETDLARGSGEDELCPLNCVKEIQSKADLQHHLEEAGPNSLVVVDFFRTACGSCRYIEKGFMKLCKGESEDEEKGGQHHVVFLKHNVMNEYEEQSDIAEEFRIKVVPLFHFYKGGELVDSFATRDKNRLLATIYRHTNRESEIENLV